MRRISIGVILALAGFLRADTLTLRTGRQIQGIYLGGSAREVKIDVGDRVQTLNVDEVERIEFGGRLRQSGNPRLLEQARADRSAGHRLRHDLSRHDHREDPVRRHCRSALLNGVNIKA